MSKLKIKCSSTNIIFYIKYSNDLLPVDWNNMSVQSYGFNKNVEKNVVPFYWHDSSEITTLCVVDLKCAPLGIQNIFRR